MVFAGHLRSSFRLSIVMHVRGARMRDAGNQIEMAWRCQITRGPKVEGMFQDRPPGRGARSYGSRLAVAEQLEIPSVSGVVYNKPSTQVWNRQWPFSNWHHWYLTYSTPTSITPKFFTGPSCLPRDPNKAGSLRACTSRFPWPAKEYRVLVGRAYCAAFEPMVS